MMVEDETDNLFDKVHGNYLHIEGRTQLGQDQTYLCRSLSLCLCVIFSMGKARLGKIAVLWYQYNANNPLAPSNNLYQAKAHLQRGSLMDHITTVSH